jgi:phage-related holin
MKDWHIAEAFKLLQKELTDWNLGKSIAAIGTAIWSAFVPKDPTLIIGAALMLVVTADFITGTRASVKRGKYLRSRLWNRVLDKAIAYIALFVLAMALHAAIKPYPIISQWIGITADVLLVLPLLGELVSVLENLGQLGVPYVAAIAKKLRIKLDHVADQLPAEPEA